jgi:hypothetical protein
MVQKEPLEINLSVEVNNDDIIADVNFNNNSSKTFFLDSWTICEDNVIRSNVFSIVDENNKHVFYLGTIVNRKVLSDDFIALNPGESIQTKISINKDYKFEKGHRYFVRFCAYNPVYLDKQPRMELFSNKVEINY